MSVGVIKDGQAVQTAGNAGGRKIIRGDIVLNSNVHLNDGGFCVAECADRCVSVHGHGIAFDSVNPDPSWTTVGMLPEGIPAPASPCLGLCATGSTVASVAVFPDRSLEIYSPQIGGQYNSFSITYIAEPEEA